MKYILSIDQGTTGSTALIMNKQGRVLGSHNVSFKQIFPKEAWVEHDPKDILRSVKTAIRKALEKTKIKASQIVSIGITNQRETVVFWNRETGESYGNALVWQCRRGEKKTALRKKDKALEAWIRNKTGLSLDPYFSSSKIEWFLKNQKHQKAKLCIGTIDSFLLYHLTGKKVFKTEVSNASRTQLFQLKNQKWDKDLLSYFKVPQDSLAEIVDSNDYFGEVCNFKPLQDGTPITGILGDQQSSLFGHVAHKTREAKCTFGTGSFILALTGNKIQKSSSGLLSTVAWKIKGKNCFYALEGGAFNCASVVNWAKKEWSLFKEYKELDPLLQQRQSPALLFAPTFSGLGAPYWSSPTRGALVGLSRDTTKEQILRAIFESLAYQNVLIFKALEKDLKQPLRLMYVDGGLSQSNEFMKIQSEFSGLKLVRPKSIETTALGAAYMAGLGSGIFSSVKDLKKLNPQDQAFKVRSSTQTQKALRDYGAFFKSLQKAPFLSRV